MISICMAYKNRKNLFLQTLKSISHSQVKDIEMIVVDDASSEDERIEDLAEYFKFLKVIRVNPEEKWWINPTIPYNMAFKESQGDIVIIQNPECAHVGDVLKFAQDNTVDGKYINFGCFSLSEAMTNTVIEQDLFGINQTSMISNIAAGTTRAMSFDGDLAWYNHPFYYPRGLHFCSSITRNDLRKTNGFDERFALGINYDDNELVWRIIQNKIDIIMTTDPFVVHQWHYGKVNAQANPDFNVLAYKNFVLFEKIQRGEIKMWSELNGKGF